MAVTDRMTSPSKSSRCFRSNKFCNAADLTNVASVESFFVLRLLEDLGYLDHKIVPQEAIEKMDIPHELWREPYRPDLILKTMKKSRRLIDSKSTTERIENHTYQYSGYTLLVNKKFVERPLKYYMLTNDLLTCVYIWDQEELILPLRFADYTDGNTRYEALKQLHGADQIQQRWNDRVISSNDEHLLERSNMDVIRKTFSSCHYIIWKVEQVSLQVVFVKFAKLLFVKLWEDRKIRNNPSLLKKLSSKHEEAKIAIKEIRKITKKELKR